jgi:very-short-patch-repair endonuclease
MARVAGRQHGVLDREDLLGIGLSPTGIQRRLRKGTLHREFPGVYRLGHRAPSTDARYLAAVLACGSGAVLGGLAAAFLYELVSGDIPPPEVITRSQRRISGIKVRRTRVLDRRDVADVRGIPIATVPRTIVDIAAVLAEEELARVCHRAWVRYRVGPPRIEAVLSRRSNSPGTRKLRRVIHGDVHLVLSELENGFLDRLRGERLPLPQTNRVASSRRVDCRWAKYGLTVELNGYQFHNSRHSWEQDYKREREAYARGDQFRRYTWRDVFEDPRAMLRELHSLLSEPQR